MKIYIMRHGTTVWNEKRLIQGHTANRLSKTGKALVNEASNKLQNEKIEVIFSSPLMRTMQTANIMNIFHGVKIIKDKRLIEDDAGIFTGRHKDSLTPKEIEMRKNNDPVCKQETKQHVYTRCLDFAEFLKKQNYNNVLIVTHGIVAKFLYDIFRGLVPNFPKIFENSFQNAEIRELVI